jgi:hypothetical protein
MRKKAVKKIRKVLGFSREDDNPIQKRIYRRFKKLYSRTAHNQKKALIENIQKQFKTK